MCNFQDLQERFQNIYGKNVWKDFISFKRTEGRNRLNSWEEFESQLKIYVERFKKVTNFYENNYEYTRFILITLERYYGRKIDFTENEDNQLVWEVEHIRPQSQKEQSDATIHNIGNLTLLRKKVNSDMAYNKLSVDEKIKYLHEDKDKLFLNENISQLEGSFDIVRRSDYLKERFQSIFKQSFPDYRSRVLGMDE